MTVAWLKNPEQYSEWLSRSEMTKDDTIAVYVNVNEYSLFCFELLPQREADEIELGPRIAWWLQEESMFGWEWE